MLNPLVWPGRRCHLMRKPHRSASSRLAPAHDSAPKAAHPAGLARAHTVQAVQMRGWAAVAAEAGLQRRHCHHLLSGAPQSCLRIMQQRAC